MWESGQGVWGGRGGGFVLGVSWGPLPFVGLAGEGEFRGALREYREGLGSRAVEFAGLRFDPFDDEVRGALAGLDGALRGCAYHDGGEIGGCSLSLMCHNIRSARGPGMELLEAEMRRWAVPWDVVGLVETWLDGESEGG